MAGMGTIHGHKLRTFCKERSEPKKGFPSDPIVFELMDQLSMGDLVECSAVARGGAAPPPPNNYGGNKSINRLEVTTCQISVVLSISIFFH